MEERHGQTEMDGLEEGVGLDVWVDKRDTWRDAEMASRFYQAGS